MTERIESMAVTVTAKTTTGRTVIYEFHNVTVDRPVVHPLDDRPAHGLSIDVKRPEPEWADALAYKAAVPTGPDELDLRIVGHLKPSPEHGESTYLVRIVNPEPEPTDEEPWWRVAEHLLAPPNPSGAFQK